MSTQLFVILLLAGVVAIYAVLAVAAYVRVRGRRIIVCPETDRAAAVTVDAGHAALSAVYEREDIRLATCSRWPERENCNQGCTAQIAVAPKETLAFEILKRWYAGKRCHLCTRPIPPLTAVGPKPGLLNVSPAQSETLSWDEIAAEDLPERFKTHKPVCAQCQIAEVFRKRFPDLVVTREFGERIH
jgi:hypothetical protein